MWLSGGFVISVVCSLIIYYLIFVFKYWTVLKLISKEKGFYLPIIPFFGSTYVSLMIGCRTNTLGFVNWFSKHIGSQCVVWLGLRCHYITSDPSEIEVILNHPQCYEKAKVYDKLKILFKHSLLLIPYEEWSYRRRHYLKSFKPNMLKHFFPSFYAESDLLVEELKKKGNKDISEVCCDYGFKNFYRTSVGLENEEVLSRTARFGKIVFSILDNLSTLILDPITPAQVWYNYYPAGKVVRKLNEEAEDIIKELIIAKRKQLSDAEDNRNNQLYPILDLMVMDMSDEEITEELILFAIAATDASGSSLAYTLTFLGMNPEVQDILYNEIISLVGQNKICYGDLSNAVYLNAVISESLRLLPPVPHVARKTNGDVHLGTKVLPKNIDCVVDIFNLHRNPLFWENPLKFDPTRFLPENESKIKPYTYLPFSGGRRDCLGRKQIMVLLKVTVANIVRKFVIYSKYKSVEEIELTACATLKTIRPLDCHFKFR